MERGANDETASPKGIEGCRPEENMKYKFHNLKMIKPEVERIQEKYLVPKNKRKVKCWKTMRCGSISTEENTSSDSQDQALSSCSERMNPILLTSYVEGNLQA
ncbi:hypothetical protein P8452_25108 [Trifolium repens]|nr:hypothetical protein P8452_25108 [Trifolium repens]